MIHTRDFEQPLALFSLMSGCILTVLGLYLFYMFKLQTSFQPLLDSSWVIPIYRPEYRPELDLLLYVKGVLAVFGIGTLVYLSIRYLVNHLDQETFKIGTSVYIRAVAVLDLVVYMVMVRDPELLRMQFTVSLIAFIATVVCLNFICFVKPRSYRFWLVSFLGIFDWSVVLLTVLILLKLLSLIVYSHVGSDGTIIEAINESDYFYFRGASPLEIFLTLVVLAALCIFWVFPKVLGKRLSGFLISERFIDIIVIIIIFSLVTVVAPGRFATPDFLIVNYSPIVGPVNDVLGGKTLLVNAYSQYGLLHIYALSLLFRFLPLSYTNFFWVNVITTAVGLSGLYLFLRRWLGMIAWFSISLLFLHYYFAGPINILFTCSGTLIRWGWGLILLVYLYYALKKNPESSISITEAILVGVSFFWAFDQGIYVLGAYVVGRSIAIFVTSSSLRAVLTRLITFTSKLVLSLGLMFWLLTSTTFIRSGVWPQWSNFTLAVEQYGKSGLFMIPAPSIGPYIIVLFIYGVSLAWVLVHIIELRGIKNKAEVIELSLVGYLSVLGMMQFLYYTGRSTNGNIHVVIMPVVLLFSWLLVRLKKWVATEIVSWDSLFKQKVAIALLAPLFLSFSLLTIIALKNAQNTFTDRLNIIDYNIDVQAERKNYKSSIESINQYLKNKPRLERKVTLVSNLDHYFLFKTKSVNQFDSNNLEFFFTVSQLTVLGKQLQSLNSDVIFVDHDQNDKVAYLASFIESRYYPANRVGHLDVWVKKEQRRL